MLLVRYRQFLRVWVGAGLVGVETDFVQGLASWRLRAAVRGCCGRCYSLQRATVSGSEEMEGDREHTHILRSIPFRASPGSGC